ncbi:MAG: helix-turn-helix domain containing protein [Muribaculaceae bacterium]|nr:helix-turn-helix domain containing protein [Muribaculaceae bacterium]
MKTFSSTEILERLKEALSASTDTELADKLGIKKATLSNWKNRNSIDLPLVFSFCEHINIDWLITGRGHKDLIDTRYEIIKEKNDDDKLLDRAIKQAEEIGRLKERIAHLEREKNVSSESFATAPREMSPSTLDL